MNTIKEFIKKYYIYIIIILVILLMGKSCQSCTRKNTITWNEVNNKNIIDSLKNINSEYNDSIIYLNTQNIILQNELDGCKVELEKLEKRYDNINSINKNIQTTNNKLINKLTEKENYEKH